MVHINAPTVPAIRWRRPTGFQVSQASQMAGLPASPAPTGSAHGSAIGLSSISMASDGAGMTDDPNKPDRQPGSGAKDSRAQRLKLALRDNLKRRKSQAR